MSKGWCGVCVLRLSQVTRKYLCVFYGTVGFHLHYSWEANAVTQVEVQTCAQIYSHQALTTLMHKISIPAGMEGVQT